MRGARSAWRWITQWLLWLLLAGVALQVFFVLRIAAMAVIDPSSTTFERSQAWQLRSSTRAWQQSWVPIDALSPHLQRAVIASEDAQFTTHSGVDWEALRWAYERNERRIEQAQRRGRAPRLVGGSTITQQLAKNLLLSGERQLLRKAQELVLALLLEAFLSKQRILEIYLNHVEWGAGVFGAEAAARHYFGKSARQLSAAEAARLAVLLPAPKRFERNPYSSYLSVRAQSVLLRMGDVQLPWLARP